MQEKDGKKAKHGKRSKSSKRSKSRRDSSPDDSSSSSDSDSGGGGGAEKAAQGGLQAELARARHAARCTRELLIQYPEQRRDLRQVLLFELYANSSAVGPVTLGPGYAARGRCCCGTPSSAATCTRCVVERLHKLLQQFTVDCSALFDTLFNRARAPESGRLGIGCLHDQLPMRLFPLALADAIKHPKPTPWRLLLQLLWTVDQGSALDVSGVADASMRERLINLLSNLPLERTKKMRHNI